MSSSVLKFSNVTMEETHFFSFLCVCRPFVCPSAHQSYIVRCFVRIRCLLVYYVLWDATHNAPSSNELKQAEMNIFYFINVGVNPHILWTGCPKVVKYRQN